MFEGDEDYIEAEADKYEILMNLINVQKWKF